MLRSRLLARALGLAPPRTAVQVERNLPVELSDGTVLRADRWFPAGEAGRAAPILLARLPYPRGGTSGLGFRISAERGYQVIAVSVRGTFGSTGEWRPFFNERADGAAVLGWLAQQSWFVPQVGLIGGSYHGMTQWAVAHDLPEWVRCIAPAVTSSWFRDLVWPSDTFALESMLTWIHGLEHQEQGVMRQVTAALRSRNVVRRAALAVPVGRADVAAVGHPVASFREWLAHEHRSDPYWQPLDFSAATRTAPPALLVAGWYDLFLPYQLDDYKRLIAAGRTARLVVGDHWHGSPGGASLLTRESGDWCDQHLQGTGTPHRAPVRVRVMGEGRWRDLPSWPPPSTVTPFHLHAGGALSASPPSDNAATVYRYDPTDPTPSIGGAGLALGSGRKDQARREGRDDVVCFTTGPLDTDLTVIGEVTCDVHVRSSLEHTDFLLRLCEVLPNGRSYNVSDGLARLPRADAVKQKDGTTLLRITLSPTAMTFRRGHRIRLQVSSGAHPLYARNPGSGEPLATATTLVAAHQQVLHDPRHPSVLLLPVVTDVCP